MRFSSGITWFDEDEFIGSEISFPQPQSSTWRLDTKLSESEFYENEDGAKWGLTSEARGVFLCSRLTGDGPQEAVIKIHMQIPWIGSAFKQPHERAKQATSTLTSTAEMEIKALSILTSASCSCTPALLAWKQDQQDSNMWIPGGFILYILMEKLPGVNVNDHFAEMDRAERDELRASFKQAWLECVACGVVHNDPASRNLLWDRRGKKCYIIDWEMYYPSDEKISWREGDYIAWHLAACYGKGAIYEDPSTWKW